MLLHVVCCAGLSPSGFRSELLYLSLLSPIRATFPTHHRSNIHSVLYNIM